MIKVCGIVLKSNEFISVCLEGTQDDYNVYPTTYQKVKLHDSKDQKVVKDFKNEILNFFDFEDFHHIGIKERISKGRFAGGPITFKMEGLIQSSDYPVYLVHTNKIKAKTKDKHIRMDEVKAYQHDALLLAYYLLGL